MAPRALWMTGARLLRLIAPLLVLAVLYIWRDEIVTRLEALIGLGFVFPIVHVLSTIWVRILLGLAVFCGLVLAWLVVRNLRPVVAAFAFALICGAVAGGLLVFNRSVSTGTAAALLAAFLVFLNTLPGQAWVQVLSHRLIGPFMRAALWLGIGIEALLPRPYLLWLARRGWTEPYEKWRFLPGALLTAALIPMLFPTGQLMGWGQRLFLSEHAQIVFGPRYHIYSEFDVSDMAVDPETGDVYLCGDAQQTPKILHWDGEVSELAISNGGNEFCEFGAGQLVTFDATNKATVFIDPAARTVTHSIDMTGIPPGEVLLAYHSDLPMVVVASENVTAERTQPAIRVVDTDTGDVVTLVDDDAGYLITHPEAPIFYINHFAKDLGIRAYDAFTGTRMAASNLFGRSDRMAFDNRRNEVLATVPESGQIARFDATTLEALAPYDTVFGVRGLAVDEGRNLLLASSFVTNYLDVIDMQTGKSVRQYRLGPWMRDVRVFPDQGFALVASRYAVYKVQYLK